jgi:hypothetical protein
MGWLYALVGTVTGLTLLALAYWFVVRPWHLTWGATDEEVRRPLPGDDLVAAPQGRSTRAITVRASAAEVWPWLVQMGQGRGGFYSYTWLENLAGYHITNAERVVPEWQVLKTGDPITLHPKSPPLSVVVLEPNRALVLGGGEAAKAFQPEDVRAGQMNWTWAFLLDAQGAGRTRLIVRARVDPGRGVWTWLLSRFVFSPAHFVMERKMLLGIKRRVEASRKG